MRQKKNRLISVLIVLLLLFTLIPSTVLAETTEPEIKAFYVLHTNDVHGRVVGNATPGSDGKPVNSGVIGFARYKTIISTLKAVNEDRVLVFDAGDTAHGTNFASLSKGQSVIRLMNDLGVDAMALGNHEFNYGFAELEALQQEADFPMIASNIEREEDKTKPFSENEVFEVDGFKFGVFALSTPETKVKASPANTEGLAFTDPVAVAEEQVSLLQEQEVDAIIMLSHLGIDEESEITTKDVLDAVSGIDLAIDGHSHDTLPEGEIVNDALLVQTGNYLANVGLVTLTFTDGELTEKTAELIDFLEAQQYAPDADIEASIAAIEEENKVYTEVEVAESAVKLDGEREDVRTKETNLGNLIVDAMLWATDADLAITNGGGIRASIEAGMITMGDLLTVLPFGNLVTVIEVTGQDIKDALAFGADAYPATAGKFPHVANATYELKAVGDDKYEVQNVKIGGEDVIDDRVYLLATNDFMAIGGDGYTMFEGKVQVLLQGLMVDITRDYIVQVLAADGTPFEYATEGRITVIEE
jgi:5'-nucleotidase/UDP-sugar diphosphatase